ncbi:hypothetical protein CWS02_19940 [Enterobacter sp. EA-1]|nr:hypothetical protein CWS02_19940 [Enterobacter sp. EA-1]
MYIYKNVTTAKPLFISDIMNKNLSFEMQKVSLALLLINNGSASLLLTEKRVREETAPFHLPSVF